MGALASLTLPKEHRLHKKNGKAKITFAMRKVHWVRFPSLAGKEVVACDHIYIRDYCYI
jgi:hypothetical protein